MGVEQTVPLVGRDHELQRSSAALEALASGRGSLIHLLGEAGVGKSAIAERLTRDAQDAGIAAAWGRPMAGRRSDTAFGTWGRALQRLGTAAFLDQGRDPAPTLDRAGEVVLDAVGDTPTMLVLDDLHRADDESRWLVEHLLDDLERVPLLLVVATRPAAPQVEDDVARWRNHRATIRLVLDRLGAADTATLVSTLTGLVIDPRHPLVLFAEGSPAIAGELAEQWRGEAGRNRLISRIATYTESHNGSRVLSTLAALERPCTPDFEGNNAKTTTISNMIRQPVEITIALLHSAQLAGIVKRGQVEDQWALTHPMFADAALSDPVRTAAIRRQFAEALLVVEAEEGSGVVSAECAGQFVLAGQPRPDVSWRAARWYLDTGQPQQARDLVIATVTTALDEEDQIGLNRLAGIAFAALGEVDQADDYLHGMVNRARVRDLVVDFADAVADLLVWLPALPDRTRLDLIEEALAVLPHLDERTGVRLRAAAAHALVHVDHARSAALWDDAAATGWQALERSAATDVLALPAVHGSQAAQERIADAVRVLDGLDQRYGHGRALAAIGRLSLALMRGTRDQVGRGLLHLDAAMREWPCPELSAYGAVARLALARYDDDQVQLQALSESPAWLGAPPRSHAAVLLGVGHLLWEQALGELPPLSDAAARACRVDSPASRQGMELTALGINALGNADLAGELRERLDALAVDPDLLPRDFRWAGELVSLASFAGAAGDVALATRAADLLMPHLEEMALVLPTGVSGPVGLHVAHARVAAGDVAGARTAVEASLRCCERAGARTWEALTRLVQARVSLMSQRPADALAAMEIVEHLCQGIPMPRVREAMARLVVQAAAMGREESQTRLSERELEVLQLVSGGATNRQVARRLHISPKTVEYHLAGAFRSLGAANRTEAVELARRAQLLQMNRH